MNNLVNNGQKRKIRGKAGNVNLSPDMDFYAVVQKVENAIRQNTF